ncbi:peroxinectin [[Leptolyngbya] sp. PCC 7376]|uniref:hypothetical protein n=1 Tax=[Leptolyngbya] sp. PCC 7376 TaxID=111781 RepID=UPI00029EE305|nr:hypothetical protein [[Leptolyngbya] sp. PCC 7376]AFY39928.1 peroxinectin [[Leptolyngbya] sp. PCC 7376]
MAKDNCTLGVEYQTLTPVEFINEMIALGIAQTRDEAISLAVFNGRPVLNRRSWDRVCYEGGQASEGTLLKLTIIFQIFTQITA